MPRSSLRLLALMSALPVVLAVQSRVSAQTPELEVFYNKLDPKEQFKYKWQGKEAVCTAGVFRWEVPQKEFGTNGLDRNFTGYCAEVLVPITADKLYRFKVNSLFAAENFPLAGQEGAPLAAQRRATYIKELFGRYFRDPVLKPVNPDDAVALQIALWEIIQETEPAKAVPKLDLFSGDFQANYPKADAPAAVLRAQEFLDSLTGNDSVFFENPDLRGRELIRLQGIPNADGVVAQSQFALRFAGGGSTGAAGGSRALTGGGGLGGGGSGLGGGGGFGALGGGGGGGSGGGNGGLITNPLGGTTSTPGGSATTTSTATSTPPTSPIDPVPVNGITPPNPTQPPSTTPPETTPVPAPAGLILGVLALGTFGSWRFGMRLRSSK
jgi:hypothetical protein